MNDFIYAGSKEFEDHVIFGVKRVFKVGKEDEGCFKYVGLNVQQKGNIKTLDQQKFAESITEIQIDNKRAIKKFDDVNENEHQLFRAAVGQINWMANHS